MAARSDEKLQTVGVQSSFAQGKTLDAISTIERDYVAGQKFETQ
jgi:hypothetical protein